MLLFSHARPLEGVGGLRKLCLGRKSQRCCNFPKGAKWFDIRYKSGEQEYIKWVVSTPAHPEFMEAAKVLMLAQLLEKVAAVKVEEDRATMSKVAKELRAALKGEGGSGDPKRRRRK